MPIAIARHEESAADILLVRREEFLTRKTSVSGSREPDIHARREIILII